MRNRALRRSIAPLLVVAVALSFASCSNPARETGTTASTHVYAVASHSGNVYQIDDAKMAASTVPLVSTTQNATGELVFRKGIGYIAIAVPFSGSNAPGIYRFDPANPAAGAVRIGAAISAAYIAFASDSLAYVTSADFNKPETDGLYSFNPSNPGAGLTKVAGVSLSYPQDVAVGSDGRVYVAENGSGKVARLNAGATAIEAEIACTKSGATGLLAGTYKGEAGIFVGNTGDFSTGSVDFIANAGTTATTVVDGPVAVRLALLGPSTLIETGGYPAKTCGIDISASAPAAVEIKSGASSFGGGDIAVYGGRAYVPDGANKLYAFASITESATAISAGTTGEMITNVGIEE